MITGIAHTCFTAKDLEATIDFYQNKLGFAHAFDFRNDAGERTGVYLHIGGRNFIEIFGGNPTPKDKDQSFKHMCLEVDEIEATVKELRDRGVEVTDPKLGKDKSWQAWLTDPDGNPIELHAYTSDSKQNVSL
jgi:lactoylglutathione lyase